MLDKVWLKIGEAAQQVGATPKELRYWEKLIPELQPRRSKGNLRYYHQEELPRLQRIHQWLDEGFTVSDCREMLQGASEALVKPQIGSGSAFRPMPSTGLQGVLKALRTLHARLQVPPGEILALEANPADPLPPTPRKKGRATPIKKTQDPVPPLAGMFLLEPEAKVEALEAPIPDGQPPAPKRARRPQPDTSALGRMWSEARLPLDWEE